MKAPVEHSHCATQWEKAQEPAHELEVSSPPGEALSNNPPEQMERLLEPVRPALAVQRSCYERMQGMAQTERHSGATHTRPVCERG
jgi:hypothetical protein